MEIHDASYIFLLQVNKSDQSSDESFELVGSEESYDGTTDFEENENHRSEAETSGLGTNVLDEVHFFIFLTIYVPFDNNM